MMTTSNDIDPVALLSRARGGDDDCLARLVDAYRPYLALLARLNIGQQLRSKLDDSDLVQETVMLARRDFDNFAGITEKEFLAWLRKIMAHVGTNVARHYAAQRRDVRLERDIEVELEKSSFAIERIATAPDSSPSQRAARRERAVLLAEAMAQLPPDYREVLILHDIEQLTIPEAARRMGRSVKSVEHLWARALMKMRTLMKGES